MRIIGTLSQAALRTGLWLSPQARAACQEGCDLRNDNTFLGNDALINNTTGFNNTAIGGSALSSNTAGGSNTAIGFNALSNNTNGGNTANGSSALRFNTTGSNNIALGDQAGVNLTTGDNNIHIGNAGVAARPGSSASERLEPRPQLLLPE